MHFKTYFPYMLHNFPLFSYYSYVSCLLQSSVQKWLFISDCPFTNDLNFHGRSHPYMTSRNFGQVFTLLPLSSSFLAFMALYMSSQNIWPLPVKPWRYLCTTPNSNLKRLCDVYLIFQNVKEMPKLKKCINLTIF